MAKLNTPEEVLLLSAADIQSLVGMDEAVDLVERSFVLHHQGKCILAERSRQQVPKYNGSVLLQGAFVEDEADTLVVKVSVNYPENPTRFKLPSVSGLIVHLDPRTGVPVAVMDSTYLSAVRTGGNGALGVKYLSRPESKVVGVLGSGVQARAGLEATCKIRPVERAFVHSPNKEHREGFAKSMASALGIEVIPALSAVDAVKEADVVYLATYARKPVVLQSWLKPGTHVSSVGSQEEIDLAFFHKAKVVVSDLRTVLQTGVLSDALREKKFSKESIYAEMAEIVTGVKNGRTSDEEITLYVATGMTVQDAVVSQLVYKRALSRKIGTRFPYAAYSAF